MSSHGDPRRVAAIVSLVALAGCSARTEPYDPPTDGDVDSDVDADSDVDVDADADGDGDADDDGGRVADPGPLSFVAGQIELTADRLCDIDGDGDLDNTFADLGAATAGVALMGINSVVWRDVERGRRMLLHMPWVNDRETVTDRDAILIISDGVDSDEPPDPTDDLSGGEEFWCAARSLDGCGEPRFYYTTSVLEEGRVEGECATERFPTVGMAPVRCDRMEGTIEPGGGSCDIRACIYFLASEIGAVEGYEEAGDLTLLEIWVAGGAPLGVPMIPGLTPDVDLDHDGLERFLLDDTYHIVACIDGDTTRIEGRDCWQDPRIADGFAVTVRMTGIPIVLLGRQDGWEDLVAGTCSEPPTRSLFDP